MGVNDNFKYIDYVNNLMLKEINNAKPLSREEEIKLFKEYETASNKRKQIIKNIIIRSNLRFALKSCLVYKNFDNIEISDLFSEAKIGLLLAFNTYNYKSGVKFISWAVWQIRHRFSKYFDNLDMVRIPRYKKNLLIKEKKYNLNKKNIDNLNIENENYFDNNENILHQQISLDSVYNDDDNEIKLSEIIVDEQAENPEKNAINNILNNELNDILNSSLNDDENIVIRNIYGLSGEPHRLSDVSTYIGKSTERVRQIRENALKKLSKNKKIKKCLELIECNKSNVYENKINNYFA